MNKEAAHDEFIGKTCIPRTLPSKFWDAAIKRAASTNPRNRIPFEHVAAMGDPPITPDSLAVLTQKYWGAQGVALTVGFLETTSEELKAKILFHMNAWGEHANVRFALTNRDANVRITRTPGFGHWSYVGTDIKVIQPGEPTMNLDSFTLNLPDSEFFRVVRHEAGHTLGFPHEHMRRELVEKLDIKKTLRYFSDNCGWSEEKVMQQVLTPLDERSILGTSEPEETSIMCYHAPAKITVDGRSILGGDDITPSDHRFAAQLYPN